jgi:hypothetical protein
MTAALLSACVLPAGASAAPPAALTFPSVSPQEQLPLPGDALQCSPGTYSNSPTSITASWYRWASGVPGETKVADGLDYTVQDSDGGSQLRCGVEAANADGSTSQSAYVSTVGATLPTVTLRPFGAAVDGDVGAGRASSRVRLIHRRGDMTLGTSGWSPIDTGNGTWSVELPGGRGLDLGRDAVDVDYDFTGGAPAPAGFPPDVTYSGLSYSPTLAPSADGSTVAFPIGASQRATLRVRRAGAATTTTVAIPSASNGPRSVSLSPALARNDEATVVALMNVPFTSPTSRVAIEHPLTERGTRFPAVPTCSYDLVTRNAACANLSPSAPYELARRRAGSTDLVQALVASANSSFGNAAAAASIADVRPGDILALRTPGADPRVVTALHVSRLRADVVSNQSVVPSTAELVGDCPAGAALPTVVLPSVCPLDGRVATTGGALSTLSAIDDRSGGQTMLSMPIPTDTTPLNGESLFASRFRAFFSVGFSATVLAPPAPAASPSARPPSAAPSALRLRSRRPKAPC